MRPMLATRGETVPSGDDWLHEIKWDGIRALIEVRAGAVRVTSRSERDITVAFPELRALAGLPSGLILDSEIVAVASGADAPTFAAIAERVHVVDSRRASRLAESHPATAMAFDVLECEGHPAIGMPLSQRRRLLEALPIEELEGARVSPVFDDGALLMDSARSQGFEGVVSKRRASIYRPGARSSDWLKFPLRDTASFVIGGYRLEKGGLRIGSLLLGEPEDAGLTYRGRVGLAVPARVERQMAELLGPLGVDRSPFSDIPSADAVDARWVQPAVVVDVEFLTRTADGRLRHPTYRGLRSDLAPDDVG